MKKVMEEIIAEVYFSQDSCSKSKKELHNIILERCELQGLKVPTYAAVNRTVNVMAQELFQSCRSSDQHMQKYEKKAV